MKDDDLREWLEHHTKHGGTAFLKWGDGRAIIEPEHIRALARVALVARQLKDEDNDEGITCGFCGADGLLHEDGCVLVDLSSALDALAAATKGDA